MGMFTLMYEYTGAHDRAYVCIYGVGMITHMCTKVESNTNKQKHRVLAAYLELLPPLDLLHHKNKAVKHQLIKAGTWLFNHCRLHAYAQQNMHPM
jgi:hypothetical protein